MFSSREGITVDSVASPIRRWALTPSTTIPLAIALGAGSVIGNLSPDAMVRMAEQPIFARLLDLMTTPPFSGFVDWASRRTWLQKPVFIATAVSVVLALNDLWTRKRANNFVEDHTYDWDKEIVLITGGSSGIGESVAKRFISKNPNTKIVIADIKPLLWNPPPNSRVTYYECDLTDPDAIKDLGDRVRQNVGHPTVLFNNAGIARAGGILESNDTEAIIQTNLTAQILMTKEFLPEMVIRDHGHIIFSASASALLPMPTIASYSATKAGLVAFHEALRMELLYLYDAPRVRQTLGIFSFIKTPMVDVDINSSSFVSPILHVESVSERLVDGIYSTRGGTVHLPGIVSFIATLRGAPEWLFRSLHHTVARGLVKKVHEITASETSHPGAKRYVEGQNERAQLRQLWREAQEQAQAEATATAAHAEAQAKAAPEE